MKRILGIVIACLCFVVAGCGGGSTSTSKSNSNLTPSIPKSSTSTPTPSNSTSSDSISDIIEKINAEISDDVPDTVDSDIELTTSVAEYNVTITWTSSNEEVLTNDGTYIKPINDTTILLTATYTYKSLEQELEFTTKVIGYTEQEKVDAAHGVLVKPEIDENNRNVTLLTENNYGATITWTVTGSEHVSITNNVLTVTDDALLEGATFELVAEVTINDTKKSKTYSYIIEPSDVLRVEKVASDIVKPEVTDNSSIVVPTTGAYDATIEWTANDVDVVIENGNITLPAKYEQWTLVITGTVTIGEETKEVSFDYQIAADDTAVANHVAESIENLPLVADITIDNKEQVDLVNEKFNALTPEQKAIFDALADAGYLTQKLNDINNKFFITPEIKVEGNKITWPANENASGYEVKFIDLNKVYSVETNEFNFEEIGIPMDSMYNISVKALAPEGSEYIESAEGLAKVGTTSELPKLPTPDIFFNGNRYITVNNWQEAQAAGAVSMRVYVNGVLRREMPIESAYYYSYSLNGIAETAAYEVNMDFAVQFVGDYVTCQSSDFLVDNRPVIGMGFNLDTKTPTLKDGKLVWTPAAYNKGYEIRINDFKAYYTTYNEQLSDAKEYSLPISELGLEPGTYELKIRAMADDAGTSALLGNAVTLTIKANETDGPTNFAYDNDSFILSWDAIENAIEYHVSISEINYSKVINTNSIDLTSLALANGTYTVEVNAILFENGTYTIEGLEEDYVYPDYSVATIDYTKTSTFDFNVNVSLTKLSAPTNIVTSYDKITWDAVDNAVGYEVYFVEDDQTITVTSNELVFKDNGLNMNFDYTIQVRSLAENIADHSFFSSEVSFYLELENVALSTNGAAAECSVVPQGGQAVGFILDGNDASRWESIHGYDDVVITVTLAEVTTVYQMYINWEAANAAEYNVEISKDGETWETVFEYKTDNPLMEGRIDYINLEEPTEVLYIRINCIKRAIPYGYSIYTFGVFTITENE